MKCNADTGRRRTTTTTRQRYSNGTATLSELDAMHPPTTALCRGAPCRSTWRCEVESLICVPRAPKRGSVGRVVRSSNFPRRAARGGRSTSAGTEVRSETRRTGIGGGRSETLTLLLTSHRHYRLGRDRERAGDRERATALLIKREETRFARRAKHTDPGRNHRERGAK